MFPDFSTYKERYWRSLGVQLFTQPSSGIDEFQLLLPAHWVSILKVFKPSSQGKTVKNPLPGPRGLPIVGYLPFMFPKPHLVLMELSKKYGPVFSVRLGSHNIVVIADFKHIKEAFVKDAYFARPPDSPFDLSETTLRTGAFLGPPWKELRRFSMHLLRDLGFGQTRMEEHIKEEIQEIIQRLSAYANKPVKFSGVLAPSMSNNVASFIFGKRMKWDDPKRQQLDQLLSEIGILAGAVGWQLFFPWIAAFTNKFQIGTRGKLSRCLRKVKEYCSEEMKKHEAALNTRDVQDFMDGFLLECEKKVDDPNTPFQKDILNDLSQAFFGAGSETVRVTVDWMLLIAAAYPHVQNKIHAEIIELLGRDGILTGQDRQRMPYTEAAICETMRWQTIIPLNPMRYTLADTELNGYHIPKHSQILAVFWAVDHDESLWGSDASEYKPERFLSEDGQRVVKPEHFIPFSIGKRSCPGKPLAEVEVFLYVTSILQKFKLSLPLGKAADFDGILGIGYQPKRQDLILEFR